MGRESALKMVLGLLTIIGLAGIPSTAWAQREGPHSEFISPPKAVAIRAGRLFDPKAGTNLTNQVVLIEGEKITAVGPAAQVQIPAGAEVIDLSKATVLPGLIDQHLHVMDEEYANHPGTIGQGNAAFKAPGLYDDEGGWKIEERVLMALIDAQRNLLAGFTTIQDMGSAGGGFGTVALRNAINKGLVMGPRMRVAGPRITEVGIKIDSPEAAREAVRKLAAGGSDWVKMNGSGAFKLKPDGTADAEPAYPLEIFQAVVDEAHKHGLKVAAHTYGGPGMDYVIEAGIDAIQHGPFISDAQIKKAAEKKIPVSSTFFDMRMADDEEFAKFKNSRWRMMQDAWKRMFKGGVIQGLSSGGQANSTSFPHGIQGEMFEYYVKWGRTPAQALQMATTTNAEIIGWPDRVGTIETGKFADVIAVAGDPLKDITEMQRVKFVMKGGQVVKNDISGTPGAITWLTVKNIDKGK